MTETPASGQVDDGSVVAFLVGDSPIYLKQPTKGQLLFIYLTVAVGPDSDEIEAAEAIRDFVQVIRYLVVPPGQTGDEKAVGWGELRAGVLKGERDLEEIFGLAQGIAEQWGDEEELERNRAQRRAAARKPAAKAVARPGRVRR